MWIIRAKTWGRSEDTPYPTRRERATARHIFHGENIGVYTHGGCFFSPKKGATTEGDASTACGRESYLITPRGTRRKQPSTHLWEERFDGHTPLFSAGWDKHQKLKHQCSPLGRQPALVRQPTVVTVPPLWTNYVPARK